MRLLAIEMPKAQAVKAVREARAEAKSKQRTIKPGTLIAAEWVILITSLDPAEYTTPKVLELYRLRWRIEIAFKRMKSLVGLKGPPGECPEVAKAWVLCHLIAALLTEAHLAAFGDSPRRAAAHAPSSGALYRLLIAALIGAIIPAFSIAALLAAAPRLARHLREPPRKRQYQAVMSLC